jgi:hypothetical protein
MTATARLFPLCFALLLAVQLPGCDLPNAPDNKHDSDGSLVPIEGRIMFRVAEEYGCGHGSCEPSIFLLMNTEKIYGCCNFEIWSKVFRVHDRVSVDLQGIYKPWICLTSLGPATSTDALELATGSYHLRFCLEDRADEYEVTVTADAVAVHEVDADFTEPLTRLTWRYPRNSFAYVCGTMTETSWICGAFLDSLLSTGRFAEFVFPDSGSIPYPLASSGHYYDAPARYFRYVNEADYDTAGAVLGRYSRDVLSQQHGVSLYLLNWRQKWYRSWVPTDWNPRKTGQVK